ncbi:LOW QUALITY PROTEIN: centrosomal protein of 89 kDa [Pterocles gutturalis]
MAFFRKRWEGLTKNIARGLVPAATVAPKPAVPRTPSPRSPNPSPKRRRYTLGAAIFATALTGRTVALPQPWRRSRSESDHTCVEQECFEPYETVTELRTGPNRKLDGSDRYPVQSLEVPEVSASYGEDEDMDAHLSPADKVVESSCQSNKKRGESFSTNAIYAVTCKNKEEKSPPSPSTNADKKEVPSLETEFQVLADELKVEIGAEDQHLGLHLKEEKSLSENLICEKPPPLPGVSIQARQAWENVVKEKFRELNQENQSLIKAYQDVAQQFEGKNREMEEQQLKLESLEEEIRRLKEAAERSSSEESTELRSLRQQAQELVDENNALKVTVHRLNVELSRYQTKFRPLYQQEHLQLTSLPSEGPPPPWLLNMKYLSPLVLSYEDRIREKEDVILGHKEDMKNFKVRVEELVKENEHLHKQLKKSNFISPTKWQQLQTQAMLILEENELLMEQIKIQQAKEQDSPSKHVKAEVSKLIKQIIILENKEKSQTEEIAECKKQLEALRSIFEELKAKLDSRPAAEELFTLMNDLKSCLQQDREKKCRQTEDLTGKIASLQAENEKLLLEKNNFMAKHTILKTEMEAMQKTNRHLQKKIGRLLTQLEEGTEKELEAHYHLTKLTSLAENIAQERDSLILLARCLENENHGVFNRIVEGSVCLGRLKEKVKVCKKEAAEKLGDMSLKMTEQEKEFAVKTALHEQEMKHLQHQLQEKEQAISQVLQQKSKVEGDLEVIWESTSKENRRMRELLYKLRKNNMGSTVRVSEPYLQETFQKDLISGHDFSYCDVKPSSLTINEI